MKKTVTPKQNTQQIEHDQQEAELLDEQSKNQELMKASENAQIAGQAEKSALANQLFGRLQLAGAMTKMLNISTLLDLKKVKEEKLYLNFKGVPVISPTGKMLNVSTWKDFCLSLGLSRQHVDDQLINISTFGAEAYEAMRYAGIGVHTMRGIRKLPENEMTIVVDDIEANVGDKDAIIELIEDITIKHSREKETLQKQLENAEGEQTGKDDVIRKKQEHITKLNKELDKYSTPGDEEQLKQNLESAVTNCETSIRLLGKAMNDIFYHADGSEQLRIQPLNQFEFLLRELVDAGVKNQLQFDAKKAFAPLMVMFEGFTPEDSKE